MAEKTINTRIQLRNDLAATWNSKNPVLKKGEIGIEIDTRKMKVGDGTTAWKALSYMGADANDILAVINENRDTCTQIELNQGQTDADGLATITSPKKGDTAIVSKLIVGDKKSYTAYVYNGENWAACDGNYSAKNVYFDANLTLTEAFGCYKPGASGSVNVPSAGQSVYGLVEDAFSQEKNPTATQPSASVTISGGSGTFEIGTKKTLSYTASLNVGSYSYGPNPAGVYATGYTVTCDGKTANTATGSFENIIADGTKKISVSITHSDGSIPTTNKGKEYAAAQIKASTKSAASSQSLVGVRYMFWGPMTEDTALNSASIRALSHKEAATKKTLTTFGAGDGAKKVVIAVPAGYNVTKVLLTSAMSADATASFIKQNTQVQVEGAEGYAATAYDVWVYQPAAIDSSETYSVTIG